MQKILIASLIVLTFPCVALATPVPDTEQTKCYDNTQEIVCPQPGQPFYGQDAQYITNPHSYTKLNANGDDLPDNAPWSWAMVRDNVTGLTWEVKTDDGSIHDKDNTYTWERAMELGTTLNSQNFGGYTDWRLPTIKELSSLVDTGTPEPGPTINTDYFPKTSALRHWSSTDYETNSGYSWCISFTDGSVLPSTVSFNRSVMAVRGELSSNNFIDNFDGTVTDTNTGLMWQKDNGPEGETWQQALAYCEGLTLADHNDWRLPNKNELMSVVDYSHFDPSIDTTFFATTVSAYYMSSSTNCTDLFLSLYWGILFLDGYTLPYSKTDSDAYLRCVRGGALVDSDADGIPEDGDNCPYNYNPLHIDCDNDGAGDVCDQDTIDPDDDGVDVACDNCLDTANPDQLDSYPPGGNGCGDACECEGNFNCTMDQDVDGSDASTFKEDFGRSTIVHPCIAGDTCHGDFNCDGDVDGTDASLFKRDFGRSILQNPCPICVGGEWCLY